MPTSTPIYTVESHFTDKSPIVREIYNRLMQVLQKFGSLIEEPKKTSIHLVQGSAFAGVSTRKDVLWLNIRLDHGLTSSRIHKVEQVSAKRFHNELKLASPDEVDAELIGWLKEAYHLGEGK
jgi:hypothetical protein